MIQDLVPSIYYHLYLIWNPMRMFKDIILENDKVLMRPFSFADAEGIAAIALNPEIWRYYVMKLSTYSDVASYVKTSLEAHAAGTQHVFVVIDKASGALAGSTSFGNISLRDSRVEIGWTWLGKEFQGIGINENCKYLLLEYAFVNANMIRVEFKTDVLNTGARKALKKIGAIEEGVLRSHTVMQDGRRRDTIYYSILSAEWDSVKSNLSTLIQK